MPVLYFLVILVFEAGSLIFGCRYFLGRACPMFSHFGGVSRSLVQRLILSRKFSLRKTCFRHVSLIRLLKVLALSQLRPVHFDLKVVGLWWGWALILLLMRSFS